MFCKRLIRCLLISKPSSPRSKSVLLAKNLPAGTSEKDLRDVFSEYANSLDKIIIPTNGLTAIIKFNNEVLAKQAFKDLAYSKVMSTNFSYYNTL